jgi:hypothetical protein
LEEKMKAEELWEEFCSKKGINIESGGKYDN